MRHMVISYNLLAFAYFLLFSIKEASGGALQLDSKNLDTILASNELVFINFYADWCRFSNLLAPVWDETFDKVKGEFPEEGKVVVGKVDCDKETSIAQRFHISKYPTLKLIRFGQLVKKEYRGQRSAEAFAKFVSEQLKDPVHVFKNIVELDQLDEKKRKIIGYFDDTAHPEYALFKKVASKLKDDCQFATVIGEGGKIRPPNSNLIVFRDSNLGLSGGDDLAYTGDMEFDAISAWASDQCIPLVREITFENAEELTEEGLPFLILFHKPEDTESVKAYRNKVETELLEEKQNINFLIADGMKFAHPLHHLGKSTNDLPLIAIDSFRHMYLFPSYQDIDKPGKLLQFLKDLYSGKLHREFHYGPEPDSTTTTTTTTEPPTENVQDDEDEEEEAKTSPPKHIERTVEPEKKKKPPTSPPESLFKKLKPSKNRYTLLRDEL